MVLLLANFADAGIVLLVLSLVCMEPLISLLQVVLIGYRKLRLAAKG